MLEYNIYRITKMCEDCPFRTKDGSNMRLNEGMLDSIKKDLLDGETFTCHKTIYQDTDKIGMKMCAGAYEFLKRKNKPNQIMQIAERLGYETEQK